MMKAATIERWFYPIGTGLLLGCAITAIDWSESWVVVAAYLSMAFMFAAFAWVRSLWIKFGYRAAQRDFAGRLYEAKQRRMKPNDWFNIEVEFNPYINVTYPTEEDSS